MKTVRVDLVLPCYNPARHWANNVWDSYQQLSESFPHLDFRVILVNDGSQTNLEKGIEFLQDKISDFDIIQFSGNKGKGAALRAGLKASSAEHVLYTDIDFPYAISSMQTILEHLISGRYDVVCAVKNQNYYAKVPPFRRFISRVLRGMSGAFLSLPYTDTQCGLKAYHVRGREVLLATEINGYLFDLEFARLAGRADLRILTVPSQLNEAVHFSRVSIAVLLKETLSFIRILFR